jgi:hypothetical protein
MPEVETNSNSDESLGDGLKNTDILSSTAASLEPGLKTNQLLDKKDDHKMEWSKENELIMVEWCDIAQCYKWLNSRSHMKYSYMNAWFTIPAIVLSTITGTASFAQSSIPIAYQTYAPMAIGSINICIGILTTIQQYLKISELSEGHRVSAISWDKFARNIRIELSKSIKDRSDAAVFIKTCRLEFDRLMETSPAISKDIVADFKNTFSGKKFFLFELFDKCLGLGGMVDVDELDKRKRLFKALNKPDICDIIVSAEERRYKRPEMNEMIEIGINTMDIDEVSAENMEFLERKTLLDLKEKSLLERELIIEEKIKAEKASADLIKEMERKMLEQAKKDAEQRVKSAHEKMDGFVLIFKNTKGRLPTGEEIYDQFKMKVDADILGPYLEKKSGFSLV